MNPLTGFEPAPATPVLCDPADAPDRYHRRDASHANVGDFDAVYEVSEEEGDAIGQLPAAGDADAPTRERGRRTWMDRLEAFITRLSTRNNFWHRVCTWIWLPLAYRSGIFMKEDSGGLAAILPFRRFNRNWYSAMAGAALLGNSEIAGGMFVFKKCRGQCRVVCKELHYKFLRPCVGPARYRMELRENLDELLASGDEFNVTIDFDVIQVLRSSKARERRVGRCTAQFHVTPIRLHKQQLERRRQRERARTANAH